MHNHYKRIEPIYHEDGSYTLRIKEEDNLVTLVNKKIKGMKVGNKDNYISYLPIKSKYRKFMKKQVKSNNKIIGALLLFSVVSIMLTGMSVFNNKEHVLNPSDPDLNGLPVVIETTSETTTIEETTVVTTEVVTTTEEVTETTTEYKAAVFSYDTSVKSNLSVEQINKILIGTPLQGHGWAFKQIEDEHGVNALFAVSVAQVETGFGAAGVGNSLNNAFGLTKVGGGFRYFESLPASVLYFGNYIPKVYWRNGNYHVVNIAPIYCDTYWGTKVESAMYNNWYKAID